MKQKLIYTIIAILLLFGAGSYYFMKQPSQIPLPLATTDTEGKPVFCSSYEFICCGSSIEHTYETFDQFSYWKCPENARKCTVTGASGKYKIGSKECKNYRVGRIGRKYFRCQDDISYTSTPKDFMPGEYIHADYFNQITVDIEHRYDKLKWCMDSSCGSDEDTGILGDDVKGADGCSFVPNKKVYDSSGNLIRGDTGALATVQAGQCYLSEKSRYVCAYTDEECTLDSDCIAGHTFESRGMGAECKTGQVQLYGCKDYGDTPSNNELDLFPGSIKPNKKLGKRCGVKGNPLPAQCCPYTDSCGEGTCDPETFTCQEPENVECTADWQCGTQTYCDRDSKEIVKPACTNNNRCTKKNIKDVECCYDRDCATGRFCSDDYTCKEATVKKLECPSECCVDEDRYYDLPCKDKTATCEDNSCVVETKSTSSAPASCKAKCDQLSDWNPNKQVCEIKCDIKEGVAGIMLWVLYGFIGIFGAIVLYMVVKLVREQ